MNQKLKSVSMTLSVVVVPLLLLQVVAQVSSPPCCQWKCFPTAGQSSCQNQGGIGMCRYYSDEWGNGDECVHAPPLHDQTWVIDDTYIGQCVVCCDSNGDGIPDTPLDDPNTPYFDWKMNLWKHERGYICGLICYGEFTTNKGSNPKPVPAPVPMCLSGNL